MALFIAVVLFGFTFSSCKPCDYDRDKDKNKTIPVADTTLPSGDASDKGALGGDSSTLHHPTPSSDTVIEQNLDDAPPPLSSTVAEPLIEPVALGNAPVPVLAPLRPALHPAPVMEPALKANEKRAVRVVKE
jgi:hypothetical protein